MQLNQRQLEELIEKNFELECFSLTLKQNSNSSPIVFNGPGCFKLEDDGRLSLKMYDALQNSGMPDMFDLAFNNKPGVAPEDDYYSLTAIDAHGNSWVHPRLYIRNGLFQTPRGTIVRATIPYIKSLRDVSHYVPGSCADVLVRGDFRLPYNRYCDSEGGSSLCMLEFSIGDIQFTARQCEGYLTIGLSSEGESVDQEFVSSLMIGMGIAIGRKIQPAYFIVAKGGCREAYIDGTKSLKGLSVMQPLVEVFYGKDRQLIDFLNYFVANKRNHHDHLISYWNRLYFVPDIVTDVAALVLTVNIEGMIKNYFRDGREPAAEFIGFVSVAKKALKKTKLPAMIKPRLQSYLGGLKELSTANVLKQLVVEELIDGKHVESWNSLRHSLAHADNVSSDAKSLEDFVGHINNCFDLFYRLIGLSIGYSRVDDEVHEMLREESAEVASNQ